MTTPATALAITQLVLYILLLPPLVFLLVKYKKHSLPGYIYILLFTILQLISASLQLSNPKSTTSSIISTVGLSPVLLGLAGILNSAHISLSTAPKSAEKAKVVWAFQLALHLLTVAGVVMVAISSSNLTKDTGNSKYSTDLTLRKVGAIFLLLAFLAIAGHALWVLWRHRSGGPKTFRMAKKLLYGALVALPFVFVRVVYTVVYEFAKPAGGTSRALSPVTASIAVRVVLILLVPLLVVVSLIVGGLLSLGLAGRRTVSAADHFKETGEGQLLGIVGK